MSACRVPGCTNAPQRNRRMCSMHRRRLTKRETADAFHRPKVRPGHLPTPLPVPVKEPLANVADYEAEWKIFCRWLGIRKRKARIPAKPKGKRIIHGVIADLHIPFHDLEAFSSSVDWLTEQGVRTLWIAGDTFDLYSLSRFTQYETVPIERECLEGRKAFDLLARTFSEINVLEGNHEARERKYLASRIPADLLQWFYTATFLERVTADMPNIKVIRQRIHDTPMDWLTQVGEDCIIGHPERQSTIPLRPVEWFRQWLQNWHENLGLCRPRLVVAGHTHQAGLCWVGTTQIVETGCLCRPQGYSLTPRMYMKPQVQGCVVFTQINGITEPNSVRQFYPQS